VLHAVQRLKGEGFDATWLEVDRAGLIDPADLARAIRPETTLVSIMSANNETGVRQPMRELGDLCASRGVLFHTDAVQSAGKEPLESAAWRVDALSLAAHKFGGPLGAGVLWLRSGVPLARLVEGGAQENERRPGTENVAAIAGLAAAARQRLLVDEAEAQRQFAWIERLWRELALLGGVQRNGHAEQRVPNTLNVTFAGLHAEELLIGLDLAGLAVSSGSACLVGSVQPSHVLAAMGLPLDGATVRFSIGAGISDEAQPEIVRRVREVVRHQRAVRGHRLEAAA
jgi:cysteine desulfurase